MTTIRSVIAYLYLTFRKGILFGAVTWLTGVLFLAFGLEFVIGYWLIAVVVADIVVGGFLLHQEQQKALEAASREKHPKVELEFKISRIVLKESRYHTLEIRGFNDGEVLAEHVDAFVEAPLKILYEERKDPNVLIAPISLTPSIDLNAGREDGAETSTLSVRNRARVILPGISVFLGKQSLYQEFHELDLSGLTLRWTAQADNAPENSGEIAVKDIAIIDDKTFS